MNNTENLSKNTLIGRDNFLNYKPTILHIDDEDEFLEIFKLTFCEYFSIISACNDNDIGELIREERVEAVITDYNLPEKNGIEILKSIKKSFPDIPVIIYSNHGNEMIVREAFISGASDYFVKDFLSIASREKFINAVKRIILARRAELAHKETEERFRLTFDESPIAAVMLATNGYIIKANKEFLNLTGYTEEELKEVTLIDITHPDDKDKSLENICKLCNGTISSLKIEKRYLKKAGQTVWVKVSAQVIRDSYGKISYFIPIIEDITEIKKKEAELLAKNKELSTLNKISEIILQDKKLEDLMREIIDEISAIADFPAITIELYDEQRQMMIIAGARGTKLCLESNYFEIPVEDTISGITAKTGKIIVETNALENPSYRNADLKKWKIKTFIAIPMIFSEKTVGVLCLGHTESFKPDKDMLNILTVVANHLAGMLERHRFEIALRESEEKYRKVFETTATLIVQITPDGKVLDCNNKIQEVLGYTKEEIIGKKAFETVIHPDYLPKLNWSIQKVRETGFSSDVEYKFIKKDGTLVDVTANTSVIKNREGNTISAISFIQDITERKKIEEALKESNSFIRSIISSLNAGIIVYDKESRYELWNKYMEDMSGYKAEEVIGKKSIDLFPHLKKMGTIPAFEKALTGETVILPDVNYYHERTGKRGWGIGIFAPRRDSTGEIKGVVNSIYDITERKLIEQELLVKNRELNDFAHSVSHELKNPLSLIKGYLIAMRDDPSIFKEELPRILNRADQLLVFIDNILHLSRAGRNIGKKDKTNLSSIINTAFSILKKSDIPIELKTESELPDIICDISGMEHVFHNLFQNSLKYNDPSKEKILIEVSSSKDLQADIIKISDNGCGIKPQHIDKIFNPGYTITKGTGTGFGLAIVKKIVDSHNGKIWAESDGENQGTSFYIRIPFAATQ